MTEKEIIEQVRLYFVRTNGTGNFVIWRAPSYKTMRWDIFNVFDLIVLIQGKPEPVFIQCTTTPNLAARRRKIAMFFEENKVAMANCFIFAWNDRTNDFIIESVGLRQV